MTTHAPSVNFTTAKIATTSVDTTPPAMLTQNFFFQPASLWIVWYFAMP